MRLSAILLAALLAGAIAPSVIAKAPEMRVEGAWIREAPPGARVMSGYATLHNLGGRPDSLVGVTTEAADRVEMHTMSMHDGMMRMAPLQRLEVPAQGKVELKPGETHLMLMHPRKALQAGMKVPVTFTFAHAGRIRVMAPVRKVDE
jgi:hypothetical protein